MIILKFLLITVCICGALILLARLVFRLPTITDRQDSTAIPPPTDTPLVRSVMAQGQPGKTGVFPLSGGADAFAVRMLLADAALSSLDVQYYIWHRDLTGTLLLGALKRAADRGVRVRLLLDDNGTTGMDAELAALNAHPNAEVRLYNPFNLRRFKVLAYLFDFFRLNRRMHNKSFTVDGAVTILGGRNIGDEYFDTGTLALFVDLDVIVVGETVAKVAADFDRYWASQAVHPAGPILGKVPPGDPIEDRVAHFETQKQLADYRAIIDRSDVIAALKSGDLELEWTNALLVSDDPVKGLRAVPRRKLLAVRLLNAVGEVQERFDGISPYLVLGAQGVKAFSNLQRQGVAVRFLTNSFEATDVAVVHAGYAKRRRKLLQHGITLYELQRQATLNIHKGKIGRFGSSGASLHAKTFAVDGKRIFIGSFNFDPRSITLNTEMGLLIDSIPLATQLHAAFDAQFSGQVWHARLQNGTVIWHDLAKDKTTRNEPGTSALKRAAIIFVGWLPVEWLL